MKGLSQRFIGALQRGTSEMLPDLCEVMPLVDTTDAYGSDLQVYASTSPPTILRCSVQEVTRVPGTPDAADTTIVVGNFMVRMEVKLGASVPQKSQIVVQPNPARNVEGGLYETENVYSDRADKLTVVAYCYRIK